LIRNGINFSKNVTNLKYKKGAVANAQQPFFIRWETESGFERMRTLANVPSVSAVRRAHFFIRQEIVSGFERMRTLANVYPVSAVRRAHFFIR